MLSSSSEDTTGVDVASGALIRLRFPWSEGCGTDLHPFNVIDASLAEDPEADDLAQPEAATASGEPTSLGNLRGRRAAKILSRLAVEHDGPLLGFKGPSAPYWDFRGARPSVALLEVAAHSQLIRRPTPHASCVRFRWGRDDAWIPVEDRHAVHALEASGEVQLSGKPLAAALGYTPHYLLVAVSRPRGGHCYKVCTAILPRS
ncbi:MAG: hypothetical protein ACRDV8_07080 [Acidimicrobiales bacterium]